MKVLLLVPASKYTKNVARDLIYGCWCKGKRIGGISFPPLPHFLIATILRDSGHQAKVIDASFLPHGMFDVENLIIEYDFLIILTSTMTCKEDASSLVRLKKKNPRLKTILFGAHPTFMPMQTLSLEGVDFIVRGESELVIKELIDAYEKKDESWKKVLGIGWKEKNRVFINERHPFIENLDTLPIADRNLLLHSNKIDYFNPVVKRIPYTTMMTSRGCPGRCIFCSSPPFYGAKYRMQSPDRVVREIEYLRNQGFKEIFFRDETFTASRRRVVEICNEIINRKIDITWICSVRVGTVDYELMKLMKRAGCHMLRVGVETGIQQLLDNIKKDIRIEDTEKLFYLAHKIGMDTHAHCMLGVPGETWETINETIKFVKKIDPTIVTFGICTPYPGTELFRMVEEKHPEIGDGTQCDLSRLHTFAFFNRYFTNLTENLLELGIRRAYRKFYLRPEYILKRLFNLNSLDEFRRVLIAGTQVLQFIGGVD